jgi:hypothetical protein
MKTSPKTVANAMLCGHVPGLLALLDHGAIRPERTDHGYVWWSCGGDNHGLDPIKGIITVELARRLTGEIPPPTGSGGAWYASLESAEAALRAAIVGTPLQLGKYPGDASTLEDFRDGEYRDKGDW